MTSLRESTLAEDSAREAARGKILDLFTLSEKTLSEEQILEESISKMAYEFLQTPQVSTDIDLKSLAGAFAESRIPADPSDADLYVKFISDNLVAHSINTASARYIGHMTSALPYFVRPLGKLMAALNQNPVKMETAKSFSLCERQVLAMMHRLLFDFPAEFYDFHMHKNESTLGMIASGGTEANTAALWCARNYLLGPDRGFEGVSQQGMEAALKDRDCDGAVIIGSELIHYSFDKAGDVLGIGARNVIRVGLDSKNRIDLNALIQSIEDCRKRNLRILAIIGIAGSTDCGAVDPLAEMAEIARPYNIHFHVDGAWGGALLFSKQHRHVLTGIEQADSVTIDGHKQLYLPMGIGVLLLRNSELAKVVEKQAQYVVRPRSFDLGRRTWSGSRPAVALFLHAALHIIGSSGYEFLVDEGMRKTRFLAHTIQSRPEFELLADPQMNILIYRFIPRELRADAGQGSLSKSANRVINEVNERLQKAQRQAGQTFVSRTTCFNTRYGSGFPIVSLRVVMANPLTTEADIEAVLEDQLRLGDQINIS
jgi:glutamate decarboxylase